MNHPARSDASAKGLIDQAELRRTVPQEAFSPQGLRAHVVGQPQPQPEPPPDSALAGGPQLDRPALAELLDRAGAAPATPRPRFELEHVLGLGATGRVYSVRDRNLERAVAVKVIGDAAHPASSESIGHFIEEAQITASLEHPNVLPVHELDVDAAGQVYFTMKRIEGRSLGALIDQSLAGIRVAAIADANAVVTIFVGVCHALAYAHDRGIIHQDVKPDNIMIGEYGEVLVVDWGSAARLAPGIAPRLYGTPLYMSPEQARRESVDRRSDVYCLGATLFHALTLRPPTWSDDAERFWRMKCRGEFQPADERERATTPAALLDIAVKALSPRPDDRYGSAKEMLDDLRRYQAGLAVSAHRDSVLEKLARWHRRHGRTLWLTAAACAVVLGLVVMLYGEKLEEIAEWGEPLVDEHFDDDGWAGRWRVMDGSFARQDGRLVSTARDASTMVWPEQLWGAIAIEYEAEILPGTHTCDISVVWAQDLDQHDKGPLHCYRLQVGAFDGSYCAIRDPEGRHLGYSDFHPEVGRRYRIRAEIDDNRMTLRVDGRLVCEWTDIVPFDGGYIGIYGHYAGKAFDDLRIFRRGIAQKVPATAIGDTLVRLGEFDHAFEQYGRVVASHRDSAIGLDAVFKQGLCRWRQDRHAEAMSVWAPLAATSYGPTVRLYAIDRRFAGGDHDGALADMEALIGSPGMRKRVAMQWGYYCDSLRMAKDRGAVERYLAFHDRVLPEQSIVDVNAAQALDFLDRKEEILRRYPAQRHICAWSLIGIGRPHQVVEDFPEQVGSRGVACFITGEFALLDPVYDQGLRQLGMVKNGRADEVLALASPDPGARTLALLSLGRIAESAESASAPWMRARILCLGGRVEDAARIDDPIARAMAKLAAGDPLPTLAEPAPDYGDLLARCLLGVRAGIAGDIEGARRWLPGPDQGLAEVSHAVMKYVVVPFLEHPGDRAAFAASCADASANRWDLQQQRWYMGQLLSGRIGDEAFLAQPCRIYAPALLLLCRAVRQEYAGEAAQALADYRAWSAMPAWRRGEEVDPAVEAFVAWRITQLSAR